MFLYRNTSRLVQYFSSYLCHQFEKSRFEKNAFKVFDDEPEYCLHCGPIFMSRPFMIFKIAGYPSLNSTVAILFPFPPVCLLALYISPTVFPFSPFPLFPFSPFPLFPFSPPSLPCPCHLLPYRLTTVPPSHMLPMLFHVEINWRFQAVLLCLD